MKRLTWGSGAGDKIMANWNLFRHEFDPKLSEGDFYVFKVTFGNQHGTINFSVDDGVIKDVNLNLSQITKTLGSNNDESLKRVAVMLHISLPKNIVQQ